MKIATFQGNFKEIKNAFECANIQVKDLGVLYRFHAFEVDVTPHIVQKTVRSVFPYDGEIPEVSEEEFSISKDRKKYFFDNHVHVIGLL